MSDPLGPGIVVVGATGAVGLELLELLGRAGIDRRRVRACASQRSEGQRLPLGGYGVPPLTVEAFDPAAEAARPGGGPSLVFLATPAAASRELAPAALARGHRVVDCSSAFRADPTVPLVVPELNAADARGARLVASPNCTTTLLVLALAPLMQAFGLARVAVTTFQAVSGKGRRAMEALREEARATLSGGPPRPLAFHEPAAFNVFSHDSAVAPETGLSGEEEKVIAETRRLLRRPELPLSPACQRTGTLRAHVEAVAVELERPASVAEAFAVLRAAPGLEPRDERSQNRFPTVLAAAGRDAVLFGRLREDPGWPASGGRTRHLQFLLAGDQLRKGGALNALQCARAMGALDAG